MSWAGYNTLNVANRYQQMFITNYLDISGRLLVNSGDVSFNNGNLYVAGNVGIGMVANSGYELDVMGDIRSAGNLVVLRDVSLNSRLVVGSDITTNKRLFTVGDASLNGNLFAAFDTYLNGNVRIGKDLTINGRLNVQNYTNSNIINTTVNNYQLIVSEDLSLNGRLVVSGDSSFNGSLYAITQTTTDNSTKVATTAYTRSLLDASLATYYTKTAIDASINTNYYNKTAIDANIVIKSNIASPTFTGTAVIPTANITTLNILADASMNGNLRIGKDLTINGRLNVQNYTNSNIINTTVNNYQLIISEDLSLNGRLVVAGGDASFNGNIKAVGNVTAAALYASSDYRIKSNIKSLSDTSYSIDLLNPITYINAKLGRQDIGFIAHEVQEQLPFLVNGEKDGPEYQSVNYTGIIGILTNEIQELKKQNVLLNEKIKNIEERLSKNAL